MIHGHSRHTPDELKIGEVILITQARVGIDLESVVVPGKTRKASTEKQKLISTEITEIHQ